MMWPHKCSMDVRRFMIYHDEVSSLSFPDLIASVCAGKGCRSRPMLRKSFYGTLPCHVLSFGGEAHSAVEAKYRQTWSPTCVWLLFDSSSSSGGRGCDPIMMLRLASLANLLLFWTQAAVHCNVQLKAFRVCAHLCK